MPEKTITMLIEELIKKTTIPFENIVMDEDGNGALLFYTIKTNEPHHLLGRDGEALAALNHLVRKMTEKSVGEAEHRPEIIVDVNGYQRKMIDNLKTVAHMMAERARFFKSNIEVDPMSPFERKIIHSFLSSAKDLKTESTGEGRTRRVVIKYINPETTI